MLNFTSSVRPALQVKSFPKFTGHRILLMPFIWERGSASIPPELIGDYAELLDSVCGQAPNEKGVGYLTIDETFIVAGKTHRRPGLHVDGVGKHIMQAHSSGGGISIGHSSGGGLSSTIAEELRKIDQINQLYPPAPKTRPARSVKIEPTEPEDFSNIEVDTKGIHGGFFIASSITGCKAFDQEFEGFPVEDGDCSHLAQQCGKATTLDPNVFYWLS
jgi:hypothetical protein